MAYIEESHNDFLISLQAVETLVVYANNEEKEENDDERILFLKLAIVLIVTRFQVFVESILKELYEYISTENIDSRKLPIHMKLNSLNILTTEFNLEKIFKNHMAYDDKKYNDAKSKINVLNEHFTSAIINENIKINNSFPLGKTGTKELINLFRQFEGIDIFKSKKMDLNILNSILHKRHRVIHQDLDPGLTVQEILEYLLYIKNLSKEINRYANKFIKKIST